MVRVVRGLTGISACVFILLFWVDVTKAHVDGAGDTCKSMLQSVSPGTSILPSEYDDLEDRVRVCAALPNCSTCVDMYRGDCGYVFPTNVTVVEEKKHDGKYLCACQTFACDLAWDPAGWNKKCFTKLRCIKQRPHYDKISIEQALCGGEDGPSVRFCPLTFSKQGYFSPGLVTSVLYEGEKTPYRQYEIINKFQGGGSAGKLPSHEGSIISRKGETLHYIAYKKEDSLCLRYGGKRREVVSASGTQNEADFDTCIPIPIPEKPVMYIGKSYNDQIIGATSNTTQKDRDDILEEAIYRNKSVFKKMDGTKYGYYTRGGAHAKHGYKAHVEELLSVLKESSGMQYLCMQRKPGVGLETACFDTKTAVELPRNVEYRGTDCTMSEQQPPRLRRNTAVAEVFPGYILSRLRDIAGKTKDVSFAVVTGECRVAKRHRESVDYKDSAYDPKCEYTGAPLTSEYEHTMKGGGYKDEKEMEKRREATALGYKDAGTAGKMSLVYKTPLFDYHAMGEVVCAKGMPQGDIEFDVLAGVSTKECTSGELQCAETRNHGRFRIRKKPKTLRRYVMVGSKGERRRIRCDDKYSIDLYALSQGVLDKSVVHGNKFILPKEYLISTLSDNTEDPCYSSRSEIVYFYEDGGFVAGADLRKCGNPITEYYAQGKAIRGCEYSYIRSDNDEPFLEEGSIRGFSIVPLSKYEQGFCIDNFSRILFEPKLLNNGAPEQTNISHCVNKKVVTGEQNTNNDAAALTTEYRFPINDNSFEIAPASTDSGLKAISGATYRKKKCTFYKVEMWGGGEAAGRESESGKGGKRSGRPGQYMSLLLDFKSYFAEYEGSADVDEDTSSCKDDAKCAAARGILSGRGDKFALLMNIGVGGQRDNIGDAGASTTKGGDTILYLCSDKRIEETTSGKTRNEWPYKVINNPLFDREDEEAAGRQSAPRPAVQQVDDANCYEIARAVGGGSDILGEPWNAPYGNKVLKYHRTISTNVLSSDKSGMKLLLGGEAMFTKIPVEVNMYDDKGGIGFATGEYLAQRSLPKERCNYIATPASDVGVKGPLGSMKMTLIVPGMGGCWGKEASASQGNGTSSTTSTASSTEDKPGAGRNGAVIITCERWREKGIRG